MVGDSFLATNRTVDSFHRPQKLSETSKLLKATVSKYNPPISLASLLTLRKPIISQHNRSISISFPLPPSQPPLVPSVVVTSQRALELTSERPPHSKTRRASRSLGATAKYDSDSAATVVYASPSSAVVNRTSVSSSSVAENCSLTDVTSPLSRPGSMSPSGSQSMEAGQSVSHAIFYYYEVWLLNS